MLTAKLAKPDGTIAEGGEELIDDWRNSTDAVIWVDIHNIELETEDRVFSAFGIHPLVITDARRERHPPKLEVFETYLFILLRGLDADSQDLDFGTIQLGLFAGERFLITRHDKKSVSVNHWLAAPSLPEMMREGGIRLAMEISTTVARRYLELLFDFEPRLAELEDHLQEKPDDQTMRELTGYRTRLRKMRRDFNYHHRVFEALREQDTAFFNGKKGRFRHLLTDVYEKYERLSSLCTLYYEQAGDLVDGYISLSSHELNNTMRILTVLTAIFVPLTFLAGIYGMNFDYMPELGYRGSYFILLSVMAVTAAALFGLFKYKRWL